MSKLPLYQITSHILKLSQEVSKKLGLLEGLKIESPSIKLRKDNQIKTIQSTLAIEGNSFELEQVQSILDGKIILAPKKDIIEVKNAIDVYQSLTTFNPLSLPSFKKAHRILMNKLIPLNGQFREKGVGIFKGKELTHIAPPAKKVPELIENLFNYLKNKQEDSWLIKACVFHYELEFTHPFSDGNGRMGRFWQQLLLMKEEAIFEYISVESLIKKSQKQYYQILGECDAEGESTKFIEYSLQQIALALEQYLEQVHVKPLDQEARLRFALSSFSHGAFTRKQYMALHKNISSATASRDLLWGVTKGFLNKSGEKVYQLIILFELLVVNTYHLLFPRLLNKLRC